MTLGELLGGNFRLTVPGYQRAYSWTTDHAGQLLDDLLTAMDEIGESDGDYFLGTVVLMETPTADACGGDGSRSSAQSATHEVVDGLQRLVTVTILLAILRDIAAADDPEAAALASICLLEADGDDDGDTGIARLVLPDEIQAFFSAFVQEPRATEAMPDEDELPPVETRLIAVREHLMDVLVGESRACRRKLIELLYSGCHCAVIIAATLDHAYRIFSVINDRGLPLSRGDILKAQILGSVPAYRRAELVERWNGAERELGGSLDELFSHIRTIDGRTRSRRIIDEIRALVAQSGDGEEFLNGKLVPYAHVLASIKAAATDKSALPPRPLALIRYLGWLGSRDWVPPLMLYWRVVDGQPESLAWFLKRLDRLAYGLRLLGIGIDKRAARYRAVIDAIRTGSLEMPGNPLDLTRDEQRMISFNLRSLHQRNQLACKLVLLRLNDEIAGTPQELDPTSLTVEHVLPQKPGRSSQWREWFPDAEERNTCTQSLGNMILVSRQKNEEARNLDLARKLAIYFGEASEQPALTREIEGLAEWRPTHVKMREERLMGVLSELWGIGVGLRSASAAEDLVAKVRSRPRPQKGRLGPRSTGGGHV